MANFFLIQSAKAKGGPESENCPGKYVESQETCKRNPGMLSRLFENKNLKCSKDAKLALCKGLKN